MTYLPPVPIRLLRTLGTPELALELLRQLSKGDQPNINSLLRGADPALHQERDYRDLMRRLSDAWAWLVAQGFLGPHEQNTPSEWMRVTREGRAALGATAPMAAINAANLLTTDLDPVIAAKARPIFGLGDYETAAFAAMKQVEVEVRRLSGLNQSLIGTKLMQEAFAKDRGPLTDTSAEGGEQVATMNLFMGAIGTFKNPSSHRTVSFDDPVEAAEVIQLADLLMKLLRRVARRLGSAGGS
ncbi:TIGR02391 family protein [Streptomyces sp. NP160]|uniref:TIGR02391 family protein n=1 Tax=Streptomyces sp. NP160 TaxID=2586637 RepID=UPI0011192252|nr:TIGR02391 family protein [Streptomyces sp. NP160]TNM63219.1 TIGR02391 family protein [Streptomyces sp. NP160]